MDSGSIEEKTAAKDSNDAVTYRGSTVVGALPEGTLDPTYERKATVLNEAVSVRGPEQYRIVAHYKMSRSKILALGGTNGSYSLLLASVSLCVGIE